MVSAKHHRTRHIFFNGRAVPLQQAKQWLLGLLTLQPGRDIFLTSRDKYITSKGCLPMKLKKPISPFAWLGFLGLLGAFGAVEGYEWMGLFALFALFSLLAVRLDERLQRNIALAARNAFLLALMAIAVIGALIRLGYPQDTVYTGITGLFPVLVVSFVLFLLFYEYWGS
jgi:hypothetical protein